MSVLKAQNLNFVFEFLFKEFCAVFEEIRMHALNLDLKFTKLRCLLINCLQDLLHDANRKNQMGKVNRARSLPS